MWTAAGGQGERGGVDPPAGLGWAGGWLCPECPLNPTEVLDLQPVEAEKNLRGQNSGVRGDPLVISVPPLTTRGESEGESCSVVSDSLRPGGLCSPWTSPGQNTGVGGLSLLQGIFPTQRSNPGLPHRRWILYQPSQQGRRRELETNPGRRQG